MKTVKSLHQQCGIVARCGATSRAFEDSVLRRWLSSGIVDKFKGLPKATLKDSLDTAQRLAKRGAEYAKLKDAAVKNGVEAARLRREKLMGDAQLNNPFLSAQTHRSASGLDAQFAQMERSGDFKNLPGSGEPLKDKPATANHFNDDPMDRWLANKVQAEGGMRPMSVELAVEFKERLRSFRRILADAARGASQLNERAMQKELLDIVQLRARHKDASAKDALQLNLPIRTLPSPGTLGEEMARAQEKESRGARERD